MYQQWVFLLIGNQINCGIKSCLSFFVFSTNYLFLHLVLKTAKSWSGCLVVSNRSFSFATE